VLGDSCPDQFFTAQRRVGKALRLLPTSIAHPHTGWTVEQSKAES
jgi:hypothetical protein